ncbi:helix-turn-helix transcriptional regulator [Saccharothrix xinjiangensis]|uniref:Helix-turn-helix domain-containing protein n=1 Tax=Saccharothrix xinjiangensis TaxID=204798 RepID=A0ABV9Y6D5_9PSEU
MHDTFAAQLRRLRVERELSLSGLSRLVHYSRGYLSKVENGLASANPELAKSCDEALDAGGALVALARPTRRATRPATAEPEPPGASVRADGTAFDLFVGFFDQHRTLGHRASPRAVLPGLVPQVDVLRTMAGSTREPDLRDGLWRLAARFAEYAGWMAQEAGDEERAVRLTDEAVRCAALGGDRELATYALVRQAEFALYRNDARQAVLLAQRAQADPSMSAAVRSLAAQREAQGYALAGEDVRFGQALERAAELHRAAPPGLPLLGSTSLPDPVAVTRAWSAYDLGRAREAAELLDAQVPLIRPHAVRSRTRFGLRRALAHAAAGELEHGCELLAELLDDLVLVDSATIRADLARFGRLLASRPLPGGAHRLRTRIRDVLFPQGS